MAGILKKVLTCQLIYHINDAQWQAYRIVNEAVLESKSGVKGPVHINIPFREPFYPEQETDWKYDSNIQIIQNITGQKILSDSQIESLQNELKQKKKKAFVLGQRGL